MRSRSANQFFLQCFVFEMIPRTLHTRRREIAQFTDAIRLASDIHTIATTLTEKHRSLILSYKTALIEDEPLKTVLESRLFRLGLLASDLNKSVASLDDTLPRCEEDAWVTFLVVNTGKELLCEQVTAVLTELKTKAAALQQTEVDEDSSSPSDYSDSRSDSESDTEDRDDD